MKHWQPPRAGPTGDVDIWSVRSFLTIKSPPADLLSFDQRKSGQPDPTLFQWWDFFVTRLVKIVIESTNNSTCDDFQYEVLMMSGLKASLILFFLSTRKKKTIKSRRALSCWTTLFSSNPNNSPENPRLPRKSWTVSKTVFFGWVFHLSIWGFQSFLNELMMLGVVSERCGTQERIFEVENHS